MRIALGQLNRLTPQIATLVKQLGLKSVQFNTPALPVVDGTWRLEDLIALKKGCDAEGLCCETIENVPIEFYDKVMLGLPGRDEQIEKYRQLIRNMAIAEIPILGYHFVPTFVWRTSQNNPGRGGVRVTAYDEEEARNGNTVRYWARTDVKIDDVEVMWANYKYFMDAVLPVAEEEGIRLALHPDDPPVPMVAGVARLFISLDAYKRAEQIAGDYRAWGLDLCLGCCSEIGGAQTVHDFIEYFGPKDRICYVHFRDVQGFVPSFQECFLGEGNFDPPTVLRQLNDVGFKGYIMDDHVPKLDCEEIDPDLKFG
ncbi:MAG: mannonate dehydratase, partial [Lentisphaeria bacterium]|nr:mannonate dehydratase [Lentisphaeria bacterium]